MNEFLLLKHIIEDLWTVVQACERMNGYGPYFREVTKAYNRINDVIGNGKSFEDVYGGVKNE